MSNTHRNPAIDRFIGSEIGAVTATVLTLGLLGGLLLLSWPGTADGAPDPDAGVRPVAVRPDPAPLPHSLLHR